MTTVILILFTVYSGYACPHKNKLVNIQELLLLINLTIMYAMSYQGSEITLFNVTNITIGLAFVQFCLITLYHLLSYTCHWNIKNTLVQDEAKLNTILQQHTLTR